MLLAHVSNGNLAKNTFYCVGVWLALEDSARHTHTHITRAFYTPHTNRSVPVTLPPSTRCHRNPLQRTPLHGLPSFAESKNKKTSHNAPQLGRKNASGLLCCSVISYALLFFNHHHRHHHHHHTSNQQAMTERRRNTQRKRPNRLTSVEVTEKQTKRNQYHNSNNPRFFAVASRRGPSAAAPKQHGQRGTNDRTSGARGTIDNSTSRGWIFKRHRHRTNTGF